MDLRPVSKAGEPARDQSIGRGGALLVLGTKVGILLVVLIHLAHFLRARKEGVVGPGWLDSDRLQLVPLRVKRGNKVVARVSATANGEVAAVWQLIAGSERSSHRAADLGGIAGVHHTRHQVHREREAATAVRQRLWGVHRKEVLEVHGRMYKGVARKTGRFDCRIDARLVGEVRNLATPAGYPLAVGERRPDEMRYPRRMRRPHCCDADLCFAVHLRRIPEVRHEEGTVRALERQTQTGSVEQVALDYLDSPLIECLGCSADRVATNDANREFAPIRAM